MIIDRDHHKVLAELLKAARQGRFVEAFAQLNSDIAADWSELLAIGEQLHSILPMKMGRTKGERLSRMGAFWSRHFGLNGRVSDDPTRKSLVDALFELSARNCGQLSSLDAEHGRWKVVGYLVGAAEWMLASDLPLDDDDALVAAARGALRADGIPRSLTDVSNVLHEITRHGPITAWVVWEEVVRLREKAHAHLIDLLCSRRATAFVRDLLGTPEAGDWLLSQMRTPAERATLRAKLAILRDTKQASIAKRWRPANSATR